MDKLSILFVEAASQGAVATIAQIRSCREMAAFEDDPLGAIVFLKEEAASHGILMTPDPGRMNSWDEPIVFIKRSSNDPEEIGKVAQQLYFAGERPDVELKSSLWKDLNRAAIDPDVSPAELKSKKVCNSAMKSICGFLNETGGTLIIGVTNEQTVVGIETEFDTVCPGDPTIDGWLQAARTTILQFFHEPASVMNHLKIDIGRIGELSVALIKVVPRNKLSFCKCKEMKDFKVYSRKGTSTDEIALTDIEDYVLKRGLR